jgi:hypothetical protein
MDFINAIELRDPRLTQVVLGQRAFEVGFLSFTGQSMALVGVNF